MKRDGQIELVEKTGFEIEEKVKYLGIMTNVNCMQFHNN